MGACAFGALSSAACGQIDATWLSAASGVWSDDAAWSSAQFPTQRGADEYRAIVSATGSPFTITLDTSVILAEFELTSSDATVTGAETITVQDVITLDDATLLSVAGVTSQGSLVFAGDVCDDICDTPLDHTGASVEWSGTGDIRIEAGSIFTHGAGSVFEILNAASIVGDGTGSIINDGKILKSSAGTTTISGVTFENNGDVCVTAGALRIDDPALIGVSLQKGSWTVEGAEVDIVGASYTGVDASVIMDGPGAIFGAIDTVETIGASGFFKVRNGRDFVTLGALTVDGSLRIGEEGLAASTFTVSGVLNNSGSVRLAPGAGTLVVTGGQNIAPDGELGGEGAVAGDVNNDGEVDPGPDGTEGPAAGVLRIEEGTFEQGENGRVVIEIGGLAPGVDHDLLQLRDILFDPTGDQRAGILEVRLIDGFTPPIGETFQVMLYQRRLGEFNEVISRGPVGFDAIYTPQSLLLVVREADCYPDCTRDGVLDFFDFLCFQNAFAAGDPYADCDRNGVLDFFDFLCFQNEFAAGCP